MSRQEVLFGHESITSKRELFSAVRSFSIKEQSPKISALFKKIMNTLAKQACETREYENVDYYCQQMFPDIDGVDLNDFLKNVLKPVLPSDEIVDGQLKHEDTDNYIKRKTAESTEWIRVLTHVQKSELMDILKLDVGHAWYMAKKEGTSDDYSTASGNYFKFMDQSGEDAIFMPIIISKDSRSVLSVAIPEIGEDIDFYGIENLQLKSETTTVIIR